MMQMMIAVMNAPRLTAKDSFILPSIFFIRSIAFLFYIESLDDGRCCSGSGSCCAGGPGNGRFHGTGGTTKKGLPCACCLNDPGGNDRGGYYAGDRYNHSDDDIAQKPLDVAGIGSEICHGLAGGSPSLYISSPDCQ